MPDPCSPSTSDASTYTVRIDDDKAGVRLDRALAEALPTLSRRRIQELIASGGVTGVGTNAPISADRRVRNGEVFTVAVPAPPPLRLRPQWQALDIVYEDDDVLVIDKPAGLVVHPGAGTGDGTLVHALLALYPDTLSQVGAPLRPGIVHRLDKDTSGLIVVARNDAAHYRLAEQFARHTIERVYHAVVWGRPTPAGGVIEGDIGRSPANRKRMAVVDRGGKAARTRYRVVTAFGGGSGDGGEAALVECRPETGRTHQIRVHLASIGHPLAGDRAYGGRRRGASPMACRLAAFPRHALHAHVIGFDHPSTARRLVFSAPLPSDMRDLLANLNSF